MSLLSASMEDFIIMDRRSFNDSYGSVGYRWEEGATIQASASKNESIEARVALKNDVRDIYTVVTSKNITLSYHDVIKRVEDGKIFRITGDAQDNETPKSSAIDARRAPAEEWEIPHDEQ